LKFSKKIIEISRNRVGANSFPLPHIAIPSPKGTFVVRTLGRFKILSVNGFPQP